MVSFSPNFFWTPKIKPWTRPIVHGFRPENEKFDFGIKMHSSERISQEEQNGANFSFIAPSSEESWVPIYIQLCTCDKAGHHSGFHDNSLEGATKLRFALL